MTAKVEPQTYSLKDGSMVTLREAEPSDARELLAYLNYVAGESNFLSFGKNEFELSKTEEADFLRKCHEANNELYLLALVQNQIVGAIHLAAGKRARVRHSGEFGISIIKAYWGLGIGNILLDALIQWAKATNIIKKINLKVRTDNPRAIALYKRKGFIHEGTLANEICIEGQFYDLYAMGLNL